MGKKRELAETPVGGWLRFLFLEAKSCGELVSCVPAQQGASCAQHIDPPGGGWWLVECSLCFVGLLGDE
jgi:hypothetical protein